MWKIVFLGLAAFFAVGSGALVGGFSTISPDDEGAQNALRYAIVQYNKGTNDMYLRQVTSVIKAEVQVVSGLKYRITVNLARTTCRRDSANEVCPVHTNPALAQNYKCTFTVWTQAWLNHISLTEAKC